MPELPEVETTVRDLQTIVGRIIEDAWTDFPKMVKKPKDFEIFRREIKRGKIQKILRKGKNILFNLSNKKTLLVHQKLTGHLLYGKWRKKNGEWESELTGPLADDPMNRFLHFILWLDDGKMLALSDLRKFAKVELWDNEEFKKNPELKSLGPDPLEKSFTFEVFKKIFKNKIPLQGKPYLRKGKVKQVLMEQTVIAGIGNIYSDEILWQAKIHPFKEVSRLSDQELKKIYKSMQDILLKAIKRGGESISDFRRISGEKGEFDPLRKVYRREGKPCLRCGTEIQRKKIGGRSSHFCPSCQSL